MKTSHWMDSIYTAPAPPGPLVRLFDLLLDWIERGRQRRALARLDDRLLADIGVDHATAREEAAKALWRE